MAGVTASVPIEIVGGNLYDDSVEMIWGCTEFEIDPAKITGIVAARVDFIWTAEAGKTIQIVDDEGNVCATTTSTAAYVSKRVEVTFTPALTAKSYFLKMPAAESGHESGSNVRTVRAWLDVVNSTILRPQIPLLHGDESSGGGNGDAEDNDYWAYAGACNHIDYGYFGSGHTGPGVNSCWFRIFHYDASKWATLADWSFEVIGGISEDVPTQTGYWCLWDITADAMVAGSEIAATNIGPQLLKAALAADALIDGHDYEVRIKTAGGEASFYGALTYRVDLYPTLNPCTAAEIHVKVGSVTGGDYPGVAPAFNADSRYDKEGRFHYVASRFGAGTKFYLESTAKETGTDSSLFLYDAGDADEGLPAFTSNASVVTAEPQTEPETLVALPGAFMPGVWIWPSKAIGAMASSQITYAFEGGLDIIDYINPEGTSDAVMILSAAGASKAMAASGFDFTGMLPAGKDIQHVSIMALVWAIGRDVTQSCLPASANLSRTASHVFSVPVQTASVEGNCAGPVTPARYDVTAEEAAWDLAALNATIINLALTQNAGENKDVIYMVAWIGLEATCGIDVAESQLDFSNVTRERQRSAEITGALVDGTRYLTHVTAPSAAHEIACHAQSFLIAEVAGEAPPAAPLPACTVVTYHMDPATKTVTGSGTGTNGDRWRVIRVRDGAVMDSGMGLTADFTFVGEHNEEYQLQFGALA